MAKKATTKSKATSKVEKKQRQTRHEESNTIAASTTQQENNEATQNMSALPRSALLFDNQTDTRKLSEICQTNQQFFELLAQKVQAFCTQIDMLASKNGVPVVANVFFSLRKE